MRLFITFYLTLSCILLAGCKQEEKNMKWQDEGDFMAEILPVVRGELSVDINKREVFAFDPSTEVMFEFKKYNPTSDGPIDDYQPKFIEEWMNDLDEVLNRSSVRLFKSKPGGKTQLLFQEYAQSGYWWVSDNKQIFYILVDWHNFKESPDTPDYLSFWKSVDGGNHFEQLDWKPRGRAQGLYFDEQGQYGYVVVDDKTLWYTNDAGNTWQHTVLPYQVVNTESLPFSNGELLDNAIVDNAGNLFFSIFVNDSNTGKSSSYLYRFSAKEGGVISTKPAFIVEGKRILAIQNDRKNGLYFAYINCQEDQACSWPELDDKKSKLYFTHFINGQYEETHAFSRFVPIIQFTVTENGAIYMIGQRTNERKRFLFLSQDNGQTWQEIDETDFRVVSEYIDKKTGQRWQYRTSKTLFSQNPTGM